MADEGHKETDKLLKKLEKKIGKEYAQAVKEVQAKLNDYLAAFEKKDGTWREMVANGEKTKQEYNNWRTGQILIGQRWEEMRDTLAQDLHNANAIARSTANGYMPEVYALNHNYATFEIEKDGQIDTSYTLYDRQTVERLIRDEPELLPPPGKRMKAKIAANKDIAWQKGQIQSVTLQSILQGESIPNMARRIAQTMGTKNYAAAVRYARTATTAAQNAGRYDAYRRAKNMGVDLTIEWMATLDNRTRHDHRMMHGQRRKVDEPFEVSGVKILYPAQAGPGSSDIPQHMIWNCRCTLLAWVKGFEPETVKESPKMGGMNFQEWQNAKAMTKAQESQWIRDGKGEKYARPN